MGDHWYSRDGRPCYDQATKTGGLRPTSLADARKVGLVPSVTTILQVLSKPALETWKVNQGIMAALTLPRIAGESEGEYIARILSDSKAQAIAAAEEGTRIHDACECAMKGQPYPEKYIPHVQATRDELARLFPDVTDWVAEASFGASEGFGGKVDLHSPSTGIVVDYKGKDGDFSDGKKLAYDQHYQLAAYQTGLRLPRNVCANLFVSRTHPGKVASHVWTVADMEHGWQVFRSALELWKAVKKFDPSYMDEAQAA
jgi:hypothetical protein